MNLYNFHMNCHCIYISNVSIDIQLNGFSAISYIYHISIASFLHFFGMLFHNSIDNILGISLISVGGLQ